MLMSGLPRVVVDRAVADGVMLVSARGFRR